MIRICIAGFLALILFSFCAEDPEMLKAKEEEARKANEKAFIEALREHIASVEAKDFRRMIKTIPEDGPLHFILPNGRAFDTAETFREYHEPSYYKDNWSIKFHVRYTDIGDEYGFALAEATHRETDEQGIETIHKMHVSYVLKIVEYRWKIVKDHASTIEKKTVDKNAKS